MGLFPEPDEAEWAEKLANTAIKQIELHHYHILHSNYAAKKQLATDRLGNIYSEYRQLSRSPILPDPSDLVLDLRRAHQKLLLINKLLAEVPRRFIHQYELRNRNDAIGFRDVVGVVSAMVADAKHFDRVLDPGAKRNEERGTRNEERGTRI